MLAKEAKTYLDRIPPDEPVFILRAQDILAADAVYKWSCDAQLQGVKWDKVREARLTSEEMSKWPNRKVPD